MTIAADDDLARLRKPLIGPDDVDDTLVRTGHVEQLDAVLLAVA